MAKVFWLCSKCDRFIGISIRTCRKCKRSRSKKIDDTLIEHLLRLQAKSKKRRKDKEI